ncbi:hypothetical protein [Pseudomonas sp. EZ-C24]|uniref:hypothetical protein n=1 Tax=Pseudomonas sp. EZ-C24 TaxID=2753617 RepID=UPI00165D768E|nr:hypothetical protein [Pseudomonas sp. EZ-C24]
MSYKKVLTKELNANRVREMISGLDCEFDEAGGDYDFSIKRNGLYYMISLDAKEREYVSLSLSIAMDDGVTKERSFDVVNHVNSTYKVVKCFTVDRGPHVAFTLAAEMWLLDDSEFARLYERAMGSINAAVAEVNQDFPGFI